MVVGREVECILKQEIGRGKRRDRMMSSLCEGRNKCELTSLSISLSLLAVTLTTQFRYCNSQESFTYNKCHVTLNLASKPNPIGFTRQKSIISHNCYQCGSFRFFYLNVNHNSFSTLKLILNSSTFF